MMYLFFPVYDVALDNYVLNRQCRCADQKMLNDSPTPEEPTNLCQPSNVLEAAPTPLMALPPCDDEEHDHEHEHEESMKYRIDKASSGAASAELGMPAYEACSPKMDYDTQDELPDSPHSQPLPPPPLPAALPLPPPPTSHPQHLQQQQHDEEQQQLLQERIQHEYMNQQQQHQHLQQQHQHLALLQQQQHEQQQQQQQHPQQQHGVNMAIGTTTTNNIRRK
ncbi:nuclear transcription factor Y subunit beta-like [Drosophila rhopaloa]|uniref:Uncharacterized protein n=1 Tax=Drosophila rhopaloa TaxID=1041015 RepID=A0ABM5JGR3_DRORH|nr:nuclear transcription factor Y subunit beta-like [Drosophila rhopaloa]